MERLTKYLGTRYGYAKGTSTTNADKIVALDKLGTYEDAEEQGRLLPEGYCCEQTKDGLTIYCPDDELTTWAVQKERK